MKETTTSSRSVTQGLKQDRLQQTAKELGECLLSPPQVPSIKPPIVSNVIEANGASGTIYANETYQLQVVFPEHYLTEAPQVNFAPPAPCILTFIATEISV